jgi:hypothetical protein
MTNEQVVRAWMCGESAEAGNLRTDGQSLWSYKLLIGETRAEGRTIRDYTSGGLGFITFTTTKHVNLAKRMLKKHA